MITDKIFKIKKQRSTIVKNLECKILISRHIKFIFMDCKATCMYENNKNKKQDQIFGKVVWHFSQLNITRC